MLSAHRLFGALGPRGHPERYRLEPFPDAAFLRLLGAAIREQNPKRIATRLQRLAAHVHEEMGGFEIDGWKLRTPGVSPEER